MALVTVGSDAGWFYTIVATDRNGDQTSREYALIAADFAAASAAAATILAAFQGVSDAIVTKTFLSLRAEEDAFAYPAVGEVQVNARIVYQIEGETTKETFDIPAPKEAVVFQATSGKLNKVVNIANAAVQAYAFVFRSAADGGVAYISDFEHLDFMVEGRKVTNKSGLRSGR